MSPEIVEAPFRLYQDDPVVDVADGTLNTWSDIWKYQVPVGVTLMLKPEHTFAAYIEDASTEVGNSTCQVKIEKRDSSESDVQKVYLDLYYASKEFAEKSKMAHLQVPSGGVIVAEREYLVISVKDDGAVDESDSYFELHIAKIRKAIGA
jgi:hypothetical protein